MSLHSDDKRNWKVMLKKLINIWKFSNSPSNLRVLLRKVFTKLSEFGHDESKLAYQWAVKEQIPLDDWLQNLDKSVYLETLDAVERIREQSQETIENLRKIGIDLGGGGAIELLYFFTRLIQPRAVLETGVAAGWSSFAFLMALERNFKGKLLSSDLPYFRIANPEKYIGILVPEKYRTEKWQLEIKGDQFNLPKLLSLAEKIEIIHYDSDKRKASRTEFLNMIGEYTADDAVIIMDDIQNNLAFKEYVENKALPFSVLKSEEKFVGVILKGKYTSMLPNK